MPETTDSKTGEKAGNSGEVKPIKFTEKDAQGNYRFFPDNPTEEVHKFEFRVKEPSQFYDPCQESSNMSLKCLERNDYDKDKCREYFKAYRECKKAWQQARAADRANGKFW